MSLYGREEGALLTKEDHRITPHKYGEELYAPQFITPCVSGTESIGDSDGTSKEDHHHDVLWPLETSDPSTLSKYDNAEEGTHVYNVITDMLWVFLGSGTWKSIGPFA